MASMGSLPFLVEANADTTVRMLHTKNHHHHHNHHGTIKFPSKFGTLLSASAFEHSGSRGLGRGRVQHRCGRGLLGWGNRHIRAVGKSVGKSEDKDESEDDVLEATIEKSKKVLAMQRELLQQVMWNVFFFSFCTKGWNSFMLSHPQKGLG